MALTIRKKPIPGNRGFVHEVYTDETSTGEPVSRLYFYDVTYNASDAGEKTDIATALVLATVIAQAMTN